MSFNDKIVGVRQRPRKRSKILDGAERTVEWLAGLEIVRAPKIEEFKR